MLIKVLPLLSSSKSFLSISKLQNPFEITPEKEIKLFPNKPKNKIKVAPTKEYKKSLSKTQPTIKQIKPKKEARERRTEATKT